MSTRTLGTAGTTTLIAVAWSQNPATLLPADLATINGNIRDDQTVGRPVAAVSGIGGLVREGKLFVPNRGSLVLYPGDYVAYDTTTGWPILVSAIAAAGAAWVHS